ncbi:uncharacterized protein RJT21DRAFT_119129 [Scheffersomyces amazonensis]|uniref:uncharacterized protein n=1 Tax=Scheffersomyces amazonensis TaxID=1078765 RepID=UPI00315DEA7F
MATYVNTKQQRLIDEFTSHHVKFHDKITQEYSKLRQQIFQLTSNIVKELKETQIISNTNIIKYHEVKFELDRTLEAYKSHINDLNQILSINLHVKSPYQEEIDQENQQLIERKLILQKEIKDIQQVQEPRLNKMKLLVKSFDLNSKSSTSKAFIPLRKDIEETESTAIDPNSLKFTRQDIQGIFKDVFAEFTILKDENPQFEDFDLNYHIDEQLKNSRIFRKSDNKDDPENPYHYYNLHRSSLQQLDINTTIEEYDKLIKSTVNSIEQLVKQGVETKDNWYKNAQKLEIVRETLQALEDEDIHMEE